MRVLFVTHSFPREPGDVAGAFILRLAVALRDAGIELRVLAPSAPGLSESANFGGIAVTRFRYAPRSWETLAYTGTMAEQVSASASGKLALLGMLGGARGSLRRVASEWRPDVIHAHWWFPLGLSSAFSGLTTPIVVTMHGSDVRLAQKSALAPLFFRRVMNRAAAATAVSGWLASAAKSLGATRDILVAPMPIDISLFEQNFGDRAKSVAFVGRLNAQKGAADFIDALAATEADVSADVIGDGPERAALEARAEARGVAKRIRWHGQLPQSAVASFYRKAFAVVMPSRDEGLGLVAAEALLTGTPVIAYRSGGVAEIVEDGASGILTPPGDIRAVAGSINALLGDPSRARRMGAAGRQGMVSRFSAKTAADAYSGVYRSVTQ